MPEETIRKRGHRKENVEKNQAIIALYICGFTQWGISRLIGMERRNLQRYTKKYLPKYAPILMSNICNFILNQRNTKPTKER